MADKGSTEDEVGIYDRDALKRILKFSKLELLAGLILFACRWEKGEIKFKRRNYKNKIEAQLAQEYLKMHKEYGYGVEVEDIPLEIRENVFQALVDLGVPVHYSQVASHRRAIKRTAEILVEVGAIPEIVPEYQRHDMSKYGPFEVIGYALMFSATSQFQKLDGAAQDEWTKSVQSHYRDNPHHPEFWGKNNMTEDARIESVIDMVACRLERDFKWNEVSDMCKMDGKFLNRYTDSDRKIVVHLLEDYYKRALIYLG
jgi:hypothetical protein